MDQINDRGQAVLEYTILLAIVVSTYVLFSKWLQSTDLADRLAKPLTNQYKYTYQYGHPQARGSQGGPKYIPQYVAPSGGGDEQNFRIFINPPIKE